MNAAIFQEMNRGFTSLQEITEGIRLTPAQEAKLRAIELSVGLYRRCVLPLRRRKTHAFEENLAKSVNQTIQVPRYELPRDEPGNHFMSEQELRSFEETGLAGPFPVLSAEDAAALRDELVAAYERKFDGFVYIGDEVYDALDRHGQMSIGFAGLYQALRYKRFRDVLKAPPMAHRLASLLGPEVICWRNQIFEKGPGAPGTYWHQSGAFRELSSTEKLRPTRPGSHGILQLTGWIALTDVTVKTAALRIMPGTFADGRMEYLQAYAQDNLLDYLARLPKEFLPLILKAALFSTGAFIRAQALVLSLPMLLPDIYADAEVVDLEMKAGEAIIFTSMNMHASYGNTTEDQTRFAVVGRYTANHVEVFPGATHSQMGTPEGIMDFPIDAVSSIQIYGADSYGYNRIFQEPEEAVSAAAHEPLGAGARA